MKKLLALLAVVLIFTSCVDESRRLKNLKKMYPNCKVEPSSGLIKEKGYSYIVIDSTNQIVAVSFYPFSDEKISSFRNIR
jgi:hypothetical protein